MNRDESSRRARLMARVIRVTDVRLARHTRVVRDARVAALAELRRRHPGEYRRLLDEEIARRLGQREAKDE